MLPQDQISIHPRTARIGAGDTKVQGPEYVRAWRHPLAETGHERSGRTGIPYALARYARQKNSQPAVLAHPPFPPFPPSFAPHQVA